MKITSFISLVTFFLASGTVMSSAQEVANNTLFGDWVVNCRAVTTDKTSCRLVQAISRTEDQSLVARFIAVPSNDDKTVFLVQVPIGVFLPAGAVFRTENAGEDQQREMVWQRCLGDLCEAAIALSDEDLQEFSDAGAILFGYQMTRTSDPVVVRVKVARFQEGLAAISRKTGE